MFDIQISTSFPYLLIIDLSNSIICSAKFSILEILREHNMYYMLHEKG